MRAEPCFSALKNERLYRTVYATIQPAKRDVIADIEGFHNSCRHCSVLDYQRPEEVNDS